MKQSNLPILSVLVLFLVLFCSSLCLAQDKLYTDSINTLVSNIDKICYTCDSIVIMKKKILKLTTKGGKRITIYNCEKNLIKIIEITITSYGNKIRTFYTKDNNLIYVTELHNEYVQNKNKLQRNRNSTREINSAYYYIQNNFYHYGEFRYQSKYKYFVVAPEPITYVFKLINTNKYYIENITNRIANR